MHMFINALILAVLLPGTGVEPTSDGAACRAELKGHDLVTTLEMPTGVWVEGPWRVLHRGDVTETGTRFVMYATLDRVVERNPLSGSQHVVPLPRPVSLAFEGDTRSEVVQRAAEVWCVTVLRAHENQTLDRLPPEKGLQTRVAVSMPARQTA
ncbi:MAG TPA: hypothetical protein VK936_03420 [Longimicrobiales bacterium]|nr:hypothetical protein [Longimicrobiales bacterium]